MKKVIVTLYGFDELDGNAKYMAAARYFKKPVPDVEGFAEVARKEQHLFTRDGHMIVEHEVIRERSTEVFPKSEFSIGWERKGNMVSTAGSLINAKGANAFNDARLVAAAPNLYYSVLILQNIARSVLDEEHVDMKYVTLSLQMVHHGR